VQEGDLIEIHIPERRLDIVGERKQRLTPAQVDALLAARKSTWTSPPPRHTSGILSLYARVAGGSHVGASLT
jgi:dihydroxy-acid dehydratase